MISLTAWLTATLPAFVGRHGHASGQSWDAIPLRLPTTAHDAFAPYRSIADYSAETVGDNAQDNALATVARTTAHGCPRLPVEASTAAHGCPASTGTVGVKLAAGDGKRLQFIADVSRAAPINSEKAAEQFLDLMQDAVSRRYLPEVVAFAELRRLRDAIVAKFEWPDVSDKRLLKLIERNGYAKTVHRNRSAGTDRRTVAYRLV